MRKTQGPDRKMFIVNLAAAKLANSDDEQTTTATRDWGRGGAGK
jgi:hypothetical protein